MTITFEPGPTVYPFGSRWFDSSVGPVHYVDEGSGPTIICCHGSPTWSFLYRTVIAGLRGRFRCIAIDLPGFGLSVRPKDFRYTIAELTSVVGELVDNLDLPEFIVVGHDWGGPIGLGVATGRADRVAGIVLANTIFWPELPVANRLFSVVMGSGPMRRRIIEQNLLVEKFLLGRAGPELTEAEADHYRGVQPDPESRAGLAAMPGQIRAARPLLAELERDVPRLLGTKPALAVWGMRDLVFRPKTCLPRVRAAFADLEVIEVADANHFVPEDCPDVLIEAITTRFA